MSNRMQRIAVDNEGIVERGSYRAAGEDVGIGGLLDAARRGTVSYTPEALDALVAAGAPGPGPAVVEVTGEGGVAAARRLAGGRGRVGVLNFASARNPGGGYLRGARAQEEDLCRSALLYTCLVEASDYYAAHRASADLRYSHRVIVSPDVPVIRDDGGELTRPWPVTFLTSPAPNAGELRKREDALDVREVLAERALRVLAVAARHEVRELVLGAWGCGVFANDPAEVAEAFAAGLRRYGAAFDRVVFAVWDRRTPSPNRAAFEARFGQAGGGARWVAPA
ncbi:TIGR02452 family protein [Nocardia thailandica]|uniref:TIGR02452 family protein n=1 Tax=Nocardia thailandica TaxID=257275 RepID=UPI0005BD8CB0|nr:TIGR02452 family protein [Nocardia thailandica]